MCVCVCVRARVCVCLSPTRVEQELWSSYIGISSEEGRGRRRKGRMGTLTNVVCNNTVYTVWEGPPDVVGTFLVPGSNAR